MRLATIAAIAIPAALAGCVAGPQGPGIQGRQTVDVPNFSISFNRALCAINDVEIRSRGPALNTMVKTLITTVKGRTSGIFLVTCPPVMPGGSAACQITNISTEAPALSAGIGCGGWDAFAFTN